MEIADNSNTIVGKYCGNQTGKQVVLGGDYAVLTFSSDNTAPAKGFVIILTVVQPSKSNKKCFFFFHLQFVNLLVDVDAFEMSPRALSLRPKRSLIYLNARQPVK